MKNSLCLVLFLVACKSSDANTPSNAVACATGAPELDAKLSATRGFGKDQSPAGIEAAKKEIMGKTFAFKDCGFGSQGNDAVTITADKARLECVMDGGEKGLDKFRHAAMKFDMDKLKLDVVGTVGEHEGRIKLTGCKITPHE